MDSVAASRTESDWASDTESSSAENADATLNNYFILLLTKPHPSRVTRRRKSVASSSLLPLSTLQPLCLIDEVSAAFSKHISRSNGETTSEIHRLSQAVVQALKGSDGGAEVALSVVRAIADPLNGDLRRRLFDGSLSPDALVALDEESLLNPQQRQQQTAARLARLNQQSVEYIERLSSTLTGLYTCPACGCRECYANFRSTDFVKWMGDDPTPTLLRCTACSMSFRA